MCTLDTFSALTQISCRLCWSKINNSWWRYAEVSSSSAISIMLQSNMQCNGESMTDYRTCAWFSGCIVEFKSQIRSMFGRSVWSLRAIEAKKTCGKANHETRQTLKLLFYFRLHCIHCWIRAGNWPGMMCTFTYFIYICEFGLSNAISWSHSLFLTWWMAPNRTVGKPKPRDISNRSIWVAIKTYNVHFVTLANQSQSLVRVNQTQISNYNFHTHTYIEINKFKIIPTTPIMNLPYFS